MTKISLVAAIDEQNGLGKDNQLLCHLPADLQHFKKITMGKPIIMGRKTYESIGKPLPGRTNIVITKSKPIISGVEVVDSIHRAFALVPNEPEIMIIGGATIFNQVIECASCIYLTVIHHHFDADVFFPKLKKAIWRCKEHLFRPHDEKNSYDLTFYRYERIGKPAKLIL
ncbi:MAG: dihydrofolate reductase [Tatlockia sp.]|nr:dihydrofolate reductase [Tatlockia sp.]